MRVLLVDDHAVVRRGLEQIICGEFTGATCGEAATAADALAHAADGAWTLVILDLSLPGRSGLELLKDLRERWPALPVLVMSMHAEREYVVRALRAGAVGYLTKDTAADELPRAIRAITAGGTYVAPQVAGKLVASLDQSEDAPLHAALSDRELEVLRLLAAGKTVKQAAVAMNLSEKTVSTYRTRLLAKLGLKTTAELIRYAIDHGLA